MTLGDGNHFIYAILRATVCGMVPSIIESALESNGYSTEVSTGVLVVSIIATQIFVSTRSSDPIENKIAFNATLYSCTGAMLGKLHLSSYFSKTFSSFVSDIGGACLGSLGAIPFTSAKFVQERNRRMISNVREVQQ